MARVVVPGVPHHVIQRGNRRQNTFFGPDDYNAYLQLLRAWSRRHAVRIVCYCQTTHTPSQSRSEQSLARAFGTCHERYTRAINTRKGWSGYLWQGRFRSYPMDERYMLAAARYILNNPVKAGLTQACVDWQFSSARCHLSGSSDGLTDVRPLNRLVDDWPAFLATPLDDDVEQTLEKHFNTGRPLGSVEFIKELESRTGRALLPKRPGRKPTGTK